MEHTISLRNNGQLETIKVKDTVGMTDSKVFYDRFGDYFNLNRSQAYASWIFDCVDIWGKAFSKVNFRLYDKGKYNQEDVKEVTKHPIIDIFARPNPFQTWWEIKYKLAPHFAFYGNAYLYKVRDMAFGVPRQVILLQPNRIIPITDSTGIIYYQYTTNTTVLNLQPEDIIHIKYPDGDNPINGRPIIANIADIADIDKMQNVLMKNFYKKGGFLGSVFSTKADMSKVSFDRAKQELQNNYGGIANSYDIALFDNGLTPVKSAYSIKEMEIKLQRDMTRDEITAAFQVNKFMLGLAENINRATAQEVHMQFATWVVEPIMDYIDDVLTSELAMKDFDASYYIKHDNTSPKDLQGDIAWYGAMTANGAITPNEIRADEDMEQLVSDEKYNYDVPLVMQGIQTKTQNTQQGASDPPAN